MVRAVTPGPEEKVELIDGKLYRMAPKNRCHKLVHGWLIERAVDMRRDAYKVAVEGTLYLFAGTFVEPDIALVPPGTVIADLKGSDLLLVIEVPGSTRRCDLALKRRKYAQGGVPEYWLTDVNGGRTVVHREPRDGDHMTVVEIDDEGELTALLAPALSVRIADVTAQRRRAPTLPLVRWGLEHLRSPPCPS